MRFRKLAVIAAAAAATVLALTPVTASAATPSAVKSLGTPYGAIAYSMSDHFVAGVGGGSSALAAEEAAITACGANNCIPVAWAEHAYIAYYVGSGDIWGWGTGATAATADANALYYCGSGCQYVLSAVTLSPTVNNNWADLTGRACVFNAPSGVSSVPIDGIYLVGHVGWAYLINRSTVGGTWEFGANEGPSAGYESPSETWYSQGSWSDVVNTFTNAGDYHTSKYYTSYRCGSTAANYSSPALSVVQAEYQKDYYIPTADCLSQVINVLNEYGQPLTESTNPFYWVPNNYYAAASPYMSVFEPQKSIPYTS